MRQLNFLSICFYCNIYRICHVQPYILDSLLLGDASAEFQVFLPKEKCQANIGCGPSNYFECAELSAGMIVGAVCAVLFLLLAVVGFVVWR